MNHYLKFGGNRPPIAEKWQFSTSLSCQTEVGGHIIPDIIIGKPS